MSKQEKGLAKQESQELALPADAPTGFEDFDMSDMPIPRLRLLQAMSQACQNGDGKPGQFQNSLSEEVLDGPLELVPLTVKRGAVYLKPGEGLVCRSNDGKINSDGVPCRNCPHSAYWGEWVDDKPPLCAGTIDFIMVRRDTLLSDVPDVTSVTFIKTSIKTGKKLVSMARLSGRPLYGSGYKFASKPEKSDKGQFFTFDVRKGDNLSGEELKAAAQLAQTFSAAQVNRDTAVEDAL